MIYWILGGAALWLVISVAVALLCGRFIRSIRGGRIR